MNPHQSSQTSNENNQDSTQKQGETLNPKRFSEEEKQLYQQVFSPKIKRKPYKNRSVKETCEKLVNSYYPEKEVSYEAMRLKLICSFGRCSRQTILSYLGRLETRQKETVDHMVQYNKSGTITNKSHTFIHKLPEKKGYLELFGLATLCKDNKKGQGYFRLHHPRQTALNEELSPPQTPPHESYALKESSDEVSEEFKEALAYAKRQVSEKSTIKNFLSVNSDSVCVKKKPVLQANTKRSDVVIDGEEREYIKREKKFEVSETKLSAEDKLYEDRLFRALDSSCQEAS